ncbi:MAG: hypothetical protein ABSH16_05750 [Sedimentisphaerales bacterium]
MKWQIDYIEKEGIVSANASGKTTLDEHRKFTAEAIACARKHNTHKIFIDFTKMAPDLTVLQIDDLPGILEQAGVTPEYKMAVLFDFSSPLKNNFVFFGNVTIIKSLKVKPFADKKSAFEWLNQDPADKPQ